MPAFKMKAKSTRKCVTGERGSAHVCQNSIKISKHTNCPVHETPKPYKPLQNNEKGSGKIEMVAEDIVKDEDLFSNEDLGFIEKMECQPSTCFSNMETMFPPIVDLNDNNCKSNYHDYPGIDDDHASIRYAVANYDFVMGNDHRECLYFLPDFGCVEPSILFDMSDSCLMLPSLEETLETIDTQYPGSCEEFQENTDNSRFYVVNHHIPSLQADDDCANPEETDADYFDPQLFLRNIPELSDYRSSLLPGLQPEETCEKKHVTLVLDLDETLIHSSMKPCDNVDFTIQVFFNMKEHTVYVRERPFLRPFLERVAGMFEIIVFTASERVYAEPLLDKLDPEKKFFSRCAFRESCILSDGSFTKDLTVLGIDLAKVAIIDNSPQVFRLQVNNGIPIKSWYDDPSDRALIALLPLLETLVDVEDVRPILARTLSA